MRTNKGYPGVVVNVRDVSGQVVDQILDVFEHRIGGKFFRGRDLFKEVLADQRNVASGPGRFRFGPYVGLVKQPNGKDELRIASMEFVAPGSTVVAVEDVIEGSDTFLSAVDRHRAKRPVRESEPSEGLCFA